MWKQKRFCSAFCSFFEID
uniref:Uncharacterized protein n=1 Tax=Rhizophora mucronata TaxID=61149 RepID=A0A2P2N9I6_RHIMU